MPGMELACKMENKLYKRSTIVFPGELKTLTSRSLGRNFGKDERTLVHDICIALDQNMSGDIWTSAAVAEEEKCVSKNSGRNVRKVDENFTHENNSLDDDLSQVASVLAAIGDEFNERYQLNALTFLEVTIADLFSVFMETIKQLSNG